MVDFVEAVLLVLMLSVPGEPTQQMQIPQPSIAACSEKARELLGHRPDIRTHVRSATCFVVSQKANPA